MKYSCGTEVMLGDEIMVGHGPQKESLARVIAIGTNQAIQGLDPSVYSGAKGAGIIDQDTVVVEWVEANPLAHNDPRYAPVGTYMTSQGLGCDTFVRRGQSKG